MFDRRATVPLTLFSAPRVHLVLALDLNIPLKNWNSRAKLPVATNLKLVPFFFLENSVGSFIL